MYKQTGKGGWDIMRQSGYYWVLFDGWEVALYDKESKVWYLTGSDNSYKDSDFKQINEKMIVNEAD